MSPTFLLVSVASQIIGIIGCVRLFQSKGKNPLGGVAIGLLFGVLGWAAASGILRSDHRSFRLTR